MLLYSPVTISGVNKRTIKIKMYKDNNFCVIKYFVNNSRKINMHLFNSICGQSCSYCTHLVCRVSF